MSATAVLSKPYWRWRRYRRTRGLDRRPGAVAKPWNGIILAIALVGLLASIDAYTKEKLITSDWAWHSQPSSWLVWPILAILVTAPLLLVPLVRPAAVFALAGLLGNLVSELRFDIIANPIQIQTADHPVAFNLADVYLILGFVLAGYAVVIAFWNIANPRRQP